MSIETDMLKWSKTVYGIAHALYIAKQIDFGNLAEIEKSLIDAETWNRSELGFESSLPMKSFEKGSIKLDGKEHEIMFGFISENIVEMLFNNLAILTDEWLDQLINQSGIQAPNYLTSKAEWVKSKIVLDYKWASNGLLELCAIRNAIVHNEGIINESSMDILTKAECKSISIGHKIQLSFGDLFRYRRAIRTVIGELKKMNGKHK